MTLTPLLAMALDSIARDRAFFAAVPESFRFVVVDQSTLEDPNGTSTIPGGRVRGDEERGPAQLVIVPFDGRGPRVTLGRSASRSDIVIRDRRVSSVHAAIVPGEMGSSWLVDLSSSNGTFMGAHCLAPGETGRAALGPGAVFALSDVTIRFLDRELLRRLVADTPTP